MSNDNSVLLLKRFRSGDEAAADELFRKYVERLTRLAKRRLSSKLSRRVDPEDVAQSAFRSFFGAAREGRFALERSGDLWRLLATITVNKVHRQVERHVKVAGRTVDAEQEMGGSSSVLTPEALASEPLAEEIAIAVEELQQLMRDLKPDQRRMLELRLQGHTHEEIAAECQCAERTVRRMIEKLKQRLERRAVESTLPG